MAQNELVIKILGIVAALGIILTIGFCAGFIYTNIQLEDMTQKYHKATETLQVSEEGLLVINDWYTADGYENAVDWWNAYQDYKKNLSGLKDKVLSSDYAGYATEEQLKRLEAMDNEVKDTRSVQKLKDISAEFDDINQTIIDAKNTAESAAIVYYPVSYSGDSYDTPSGGLTAFSGVNYHNGRTETYYSSNVLYHNRTSEWTLDNEGFYRDNDGNYVVAASDVPQGDTIETSKGTAIVLDSGCDAGVTDFYTAW